MKNNQIQSQHQQGALVAPYQSEVPHNQGSIVTSNTARRSFAFDLVKVKLTFVGGQDSDEDKLRALSVITTNINRFQREVYQKITKNKKRKFIPDLADGIRRDVIQRTFSITFDYTGRDTLADFVELTEALKAAKPIYEISFTMKELDKKYNELLREASAGAKDRAHALADGVGLSIKKCLKVEYDERTDMRELEGKLASNSLLAENYEVPAPTDKNQPMDAKMENKLSGEIIKHIRETFVPEEVEIAASVKCVWLAE